MTRFQYFVLHPRTGELTVGTAFPANPSSEASQDSSRPGHQSRTDFNPYLHDEYLLDIRVNDSASAMAGGHAGAYARETAKSSSRKFYVRVEYGVGGAIGAIRESDVIAVTGGPLDAVTRLLATHGLQVRLTCERYLSHKRVMYKILRSETTNRKLSTLELDLQSISFLHTVFVLCTLYAAGAAGSRPRVPPAGGAGRIAAGALPLARRERLARPLEARLAGRGAPRGAAARVLRVSHLPALSVVPLLLLPPPAAREVARLCAAGRRRDRSGARVARERRARSSHEDTCARALNTDLVLLSEVNVLI